VNFRSTSGHYYFRFSEASGGVQVSTSLADTPGIEWHFDDSAVSHAFQIRVPKELANLEDIACAVHLADRLGRRPSSRKGGWARHLSLAIPISDVTRWADPTLVEDLTSLLWFQTDDRWNFEFRERRTLRLSEIEQPLFSLPLRNGARAALFSGGLDSLAGLCADLAERPDQDFVVVLIRTSSRVGYLQDQLLDSIRHRFKAGRREIVPVVLHLRFGAENHDFDDEEGSQRSRGFSLCNPRRRGGTGCRS